MTPLISALGIGILVILTMDYAYRRFASRRIRRLVDNVPLFSGLTSEPGDSARTFRIPTADGLQLQASLHCETSSPRAVIVFCPELHGTHWTATRYCPALVSAGFAVLSFDFRSQGDSDEHEGYVPIQWISEYELRDVQAVLRHIEKDSLLRDLPVGMFGVSRGGSAALITSCRDERIQSVVTDSGYDTFALVQNFISRFSQYVVPDWFFRRLPQWHVDLVLRQALNQSQRRRGCTYAYLTGELARNAQPTLLISGRRDSYVTERLTQRMGRQLGGGDGVWIVPKAKHNKSRTIAEKEYDEKLVHHFETTLLPNVQPTAMLKNRVA